MVELRQAIVKMVRHIRRSYLGHRSLVIRDSGEEVERRVKGISESGRSGGGNADVAIFLKKFLKSVDFKVYELEIWGYL